MRDWYLVVRESAGKRKRGGITHQGSNTLRWIMLQGAQVAARKSAPVSQWYKRLRALKPGQVENLLWARKLLNAAWAMLRYRVCFDEQMFARSC